MNSTQWTTLTQYVNWLGEQGICEVDFQDDGTGQNGSQGNRGGWYIKFIDRDPESEKRKLEIDRLAKKQKDMDERHNVKIAEMVAADSERKTAMDFAESNVDLKTKNLDLESHKKVIMSISASKSAILQKYSMNSLDDANGLGFKSLVAMTAFNTSGTKEETGLMKPGRKRDKPMSCIEEIMLKDGMAKDQIYKKKNTDDILATGCLKNVDGAGLYVKKDKETNKKEESDGSKTDKKESRREGKIVKLPEIVDDEEEPWLLENILVKVTTKDLGPTYYKKKGKVLKVENKYEAIVQMVNGSAKVKFDQTHLETVIPNINRDVMVLVGKYAGRVGVLKSIQQETATCSVELDQTAKHKAKFITNLKYTQISKFLK